jgi:segregation and condensation protein B
LDFLSRHIEALIFCSPQPIPLDDIKRCLEELFDHPIEKTDIENAINELLKKFNKEEYAFEVQKLANGYQFLSKPAYQNSISILLKQQSKRKLSNSALETLSIIVYKQPVTKAQVEQIRGVNCDYTIQKLLEKELIEIKGKAESLGRPLLYGTNKKFMEYFGINNLNDLPTPKDFATDENSIGEVKE